MNKNSKQDFPIFKNNPSLVYLDSAATSQKPYQVIEAIKKFYEHTNSNIHRGLYKLSEDATMQYEQTRKTVADFIGSKDSKEIIFTHGTTEGINILANGLKNIISQGDAILISEMEHHSNIVPWQVVAKEKKARLLFWAVDKNGELSDQIKDQIQNLKIVSLTHVSNVLGTINSMKEIIQKLRTVNGELVIIVDAAQSVPHMPVNVQDLDCDFLVFSGHKIMAPTGVGILYGKKRQLEKLEPFLVGSQMIREVSKKVSTWTTIPHKFEPGTMPIEGVIGLGAAIEYIKTTGIENIRKHEERLLLYSLEKMDHIGGLTIYGPRDIKKRSSVISFSLDGVHPHDIAQILGDMHICIRAGHHCAMPLHTTLGVPATTRASFYIYNDESDIDKLIEGIEKVKKTFLV